MLTTLFDAAAVQAVYHGSDGLLAAANGKLFVEMSTMRPIDQQLLAKTVRQRGSDFIECPVGGTTGPARAGQLLGLAGGEIKDLQRARPVLDALCRRVELMGPVGSGASAKLAINLPLIVFWQAFGEALALVGLEGKDPQWLVQLFSETAGAPNVLKAKGAAVVRALSGDPSIEPTFDVDTMRKDLQLIMAEATSCGITLPLAAQTLLAFDQASGAGLGKADCAEIPAYWLAKA